MLSVTWQTAGMPPRLLDAKSVQMHGSMAQEPDSGILPPLCTVEALRKSDILVASLLAKPPVVGKPKEARIGVLHASHCAQLSSCPDREIKCSSGDRVSFDYLLALPEAEWVIRRAKTCIPPTIAGSAESRTGGAR